MKNNKSYSNDRLTEKFFENEKPEHVLYLKKFRVYQCQDECQSENCINYHHGQVHRRRPFLTAEGKWNYSPKMCSNPSPCKSGNKCRFAHTREESYYHPLVYKINYCNFAMADGKKCSK